MKYVSLDVETTGMNRRDDQLLMLSMIATDSEDFVSDIDGLPSLTVAIAYERISFTGESFPIVNTLGFMKVYMDMLKNGNTYTLDNVHYPIENFLELNGFDLSKGITVAGKNVARFDMPFLEKISPLAVQFKDRMCDPAILYALPGDSAIPDMKTCCERAGVVYDAEKAHHPLYDAQLVVMLLRKHFSRM